MTAAPRARSPRRKARELWIDIPSDSGLWGPPAVCSWQHLRDRCAGAVLFREVLPVAKPTAAKLAKRKGAK